jgi:hypothetical protein
MQYSSTFLSGLQMRLLAVFNVSVGQEYLSIYLRCFSIF